MSNSTFVYLDNAATTPLHAVARAAMEPYWSQIYGNASSPYAISREARMALDGARTAVARLIGAHADEVVWTSGGTESDNWALLGVALYYMQEKGHFIVSAVEHHAVLETAGLLRELGFQVDIAHCDAQGVVGPATIAALLRPDTRLVSLMSANNETGVCQPIGAVARLCSRAGVLLHVDATQSAGKVPLDVDIVEEGQTEVGQVDLMTLSAHKLGGPKGVGALYVRRGARTRSLQRGGAQERNRRAGTENVPGIVGFGAVAEFALRHMAEQSGHLASLQNRLVQGLEALPGVQLVAPQAPRLPHIVCFTCKDKRAESLAVNLDLRGFAIGTGSACASGALEPSHVLAAMGYNAAQARGALRVSLGWQNTELEVDQFLAALQELLQ